MAVDNSPTSPFRDRIYVAWTIVRGRRHRLHLRGALRRLRADLQQPGAGEHDERSLCTNTFGLPTPHGTCNENQCSDPFTGPDGTLYVAYSNFNNSTTGAATTTSRCC